MRRRQIAAQRKTGPRVVLVNGCFDPLHPGHLHHLREAKKLGDRLIVALTADTHIGKPGHPIFSQEERAALLREMRCVDEVVLVNSGDEAVRRIRPDIYVKGQEYAGKLTEQPYVESYGGRVVFTGGPTYSSTALASGRYWKAERLGAGRRNNR